MLSLLLGRIYLALIIFLRTRISPSAFKTDSCEKAVLSFLFTVIWLRAWLIHIILNFSVFVLVRTILVFHIAWALKWRNIVNCLCILIPYCGIIVMSGSVWSIICRQQGLPALVPILLSESTLIWPLLTAYGASSSLFFCFIITRQFQRIKSTYAIVNFSCVTV